MLNKKNEHSEAIEIHTQAYMYSDLKQVVKQNKQQILLELKTAEIFVLIIKYWVNLEMSQKENYQLSYNQEGCKK